MKGKASKAAEAEPAAGGRRTRSGRAVSRAETSGDAAPSAPDAEQQQQAASQEQQQTVEQSPGRRRPVLREKKTNKKAKIQPPDADEADAAADQAAAAAAAEPSGAAPVTGAAAAAAEGSDKEPAAAAAASEIEAADEQATSAQAAADTAAADDDTSMSPVPAAGAGMVPSSVQDTTPARAGLHAGMHPAGPAAAGSSPAQQRRTAQHISSPVLGPIVLVPMVPPATVRMGGNRSPAGQQGVSCQAAAGRSPGQLPRASVSWCHPATAAQLSERDGTGLTFPAAGAAAGAGGVHGRSPARAAPRPRSTVSWCQPAEELQPVHRYALVLGRQSRVHTNCSASRV